MSPPVLGRVYEAGPVDAHIAQLHEHVAELNRQLDELRRPHGGETVDESDERVIGRALLQAERAAEAVLESARQEAAEIRAAADRELAALKDSSHHEVNAITTAARSSAENAAAAAASEVESIRQSAARKAEELVAYASDKARQVLTRSRPNDAPVVRQAERDVVIEQPPTARRGVGPFAGGAPPLIVATAAHAHETHQGLGSWADLAAVSWPPSMGDPVRRSNGVHPPVTPAPLLRNGERPPGPWSDAAMTRAATTRPPTAVMPQAGPGSVSFLPPPSGDPIMPPPSGAPIIPIDSDAR